MRLSHFALASLFALAACAPPPVLEPSCTDNCGGDTTTRGTGSGSGGGGEGGTGTGYDVGPSSYDARPDMGGREEGIGVDAAPVGVDASLGIDTTSPPGPDF